MITVGCCVTDECIHYPMGYDYRSRNIQLCNLIEEEYRLVLTIQSSANFHHCNTTDGNIICSNDQKLFNIRSGMRDLFSTTRALMVDYMMIIGQHTR
jgi:hypothetical protein